MSVDLPEPIAAYLAAENRHDTGALARCFTEDAVVRDEGQTFKGLADIKQWKAETKKKYQHTVEPLEAVQKDGETIVTNRLTGNFPGSPIDLSSSSGWKAARLPRWRSIHERCSRTCWPPPAHHSRHQAIGEGVYLCGTRELSLRPATACDGRR